MEVMICKCFIEYLHEEEDYLYFYEEFGIRCWTERLQSSVAMISL